MTPPPRARRLRSVRAAVLAGGAIALLPLAPAAARSITGVCPDGSVFVVQSRSQIPCSESKGVEPHQVPPVRPEYLPDPYTWQVYEQSQDPNNPYNLIDRAREIREGGAPGRGKEGAPATPSVSAPPPGGGPEAPSASRGAASSPETVRPLDLGLSEQELRDLYGIVELSQDRVPARFRRETADGRGVFEVDFAHSRAFERRVREAWRSRGGLGESSVLVFRAVAKREERFHANFTFVQGHLTFQPDATDPRQLGLLQGRLGSLGADEVVLGYVVLPEAMRLDASLDIYWNDRRTTARFAQR